MLDDMNNIIMIDKNEKTGVLCNELFSLRLWGME